jgi:type II secretion system protein J
MRVRKPISYSVLRIAPRASGCDTQYATRSTPAVSRVTHHASRTAFTLVEILIAMTILSLVLVAIYSTWTAILRASKVGQESAAAVQRARVAARTFEEALVSAQSFAVTEQYHPSSYSFYAQNGSEAFLEFTSRLAKSFPRSGKFGDFDVRRVRFSVRSSPEGGRELVLQQKPLLMEWDASTLVDEREHPVVLAKNVKAFKTEFFDPKRKEWNEEWTETQSNAIPTLVKVTLQLGDNPHSSLVREEVVRVVSIPAITVQPEWQVRSQGPRPGAAPVPQPVPGAQPGGAVQGNPAGGKVFRQ